MLAVVVVDTFISMYYFKILFDIFHRKRKLLTITHRNSTQRDAAVEILFLIHLHHYHRVQQIFLLQACCGVSKDLSGVCGL